MSRLSDRELRILEKSDIHCADVTSLLGDFVDNELSPTLRERVHQHLRGCKECREGEARYREVIALAKELPQPEIPDDVRQRLHEALNRRLGLQLWNQERR